MAKWPNSPGGLYLDALCLVIYRALLFLTSVYSCGDRGNHEDPAFFNISLRIDGRGEGVELLHLELEMPALPSGLLGGGNKTCQGPHWASQCEVLFQMLLACCSLDFHLKIIIKTIWVKRVRGSLKIEICKLQ